MRYGHNTFIGSRTLADRELASINGGHGSWDVFEEKHYRDIYERDKYRSPYFSFESYLTNFCCCDYDDLRAREIWVLKGSPADKAVSVSNVGRVSVSAL